MSKFIDLTGQKFGLLTVIRRAENDGRRTRWLCVCDCDGKETIVRAEELKSGHTKSCGCLKLGFFEYKHGLLDSKLYIVWQRMKDRCYNTNNKNYNDYGGRGIIVSDELKNDFQVFYDYCLNVGYKDGLEIDRIDNNDSYKKGNIRFVSRTIQNRNKRNYKTNKCGVKGVSYKKSLNKWVARISVNNKRINLGYYDNLEEATKSRQEAELKYWGGV